MMHSQPATPAIRGIAPLADRRFRPGAFTVDAPREERIDVPIDEVAFCHLRTPSEIALVRHLRDEIQLPEAVRADPAFGAREKKETRPGLSELSRCMALTSEPFALSR